MTAIYAAVLLWVNVYICRDLFTARANHMHSMHGFWIALAKGADGGWLRNQWWPYWDCGIPFQSTYAPLAPGLTALWAAVTGVPHDRAFYSLTGVIYCLAPLTLFFLALRLTRSAGYSFAAALLYSLTSVTQLVLPDGGEYRWGKLWESRRLFLMTVWDDTPHMTAVALLPLLILFLMRAIERRRVWDCAAAAATIAAMALASAFGPADAVLVAFCLCASTPREHWRSNAILIAGLGVWGYALASPYLSPSLMRAIHESSAVNEVEGWNTGSLTAAAITAAGWVAAWPYLRKAKDSVASFAALFAWTVSSIPLAAALLDRHYVPQPGRYKLEMEMALALCVAVAAARWMPRLARNWRAALLLLCTAMAAEQVVAYRKAEKAMTFPQDVTKTVEYRAAVWAGENLKGRRIRFPGSVAQWANAFADVMQFGGGSWSMATNQVQQSAHTMISSGGPSPDASLLWLKAYGVSAVAVGGPDSAEYWKADAFPKKFEGVLPLLWREQGVAIYGVPIHSLAHVVPESAIVRHPPRTPEDLDEVRRYVDALSDASFEWEGRNRIRVKTAGPAPVVSVQVSYHPGWHASRGEVHKDGLGLMWLNPACAGPCEIVLDYNGGWELRLCWWFCGAAIFACVIVLILDRRSGGHRHTLDFRAWWRNRFGMRAE